jgi:hypothetical protein
MEPSASNSGSLPNDRAQQSLDAAMLVLAPLVRWLLRTGVHYGAIAQGLKQVFIAEARRELERRGAKVTDSALSVLSGVHRKDVRTLSALPEVQAALVPTPASLLFTRWVTDPALRVPDPSGVGEPALRTRLSRHGDMPSFEALAREVSSDVHPRTLLEELLRLELVRVEGDEVVLTSEHFVAPRAELEAAQTLGVNVADHLNAAVHNLSGRDSARFLEQSVFACGLSPASGERLGELARELWSPAFTAMVQAATARLAEDDAERVNSARALPRERMRFGAYFYREAEPPEPTLPHSTPADGPQT